MGVFYIFEIVKMESNGESVSYSLNKVNWEGEPKFK